MFKSTKRLLIAATAILVLSWPTAAYAFALVTPGGQATSVQAAPSLVRVPTAAEQQRLDQLQASVTQRFASEGGWPTTVAVVHSTGPGPSSQAGFQWGDAVIGAAGLLALIGIGAGGTLVIRRRVHQPIAG
jgi:hypothetical protein